MQKSDLTAAVLTIISGALNAAGGYVLISAGIVKLVAAAKNKNKLIK